MRPEINYVKGDATLPIGDGNKIIVHICNDVGGWGAGFVMALSKKWTEPEKQYRLWFRSQDKFELGAAQLVQVEQDIWVANLIGQRHTMTDEEGNPPIRYEAVDRGLSKVAEEARKLEATVHMPRIGCGLAGGKWDKIEPLVNKNLVDVGIGTSVYDFD